MKIFLTGGTGFIGSNVLFSLLNQGHEVTCLARNFQKSKIFSNLNNVEFVIGDLKDTELISEKIKGCDILIHIALLWGEEASSMLLNDTLSSVRLFETAIKNNVKHIIYTSSTAVADYSRKVNNEMQPTMPNDFYGATKAATEQFLHALAIQNNIKATVIRPGYTFGNPVITNGDMEVDSRFRDIVTAAKTNNIIDLTKNDGTQFINAEDLAKIYINAISQKSNFEIYYGLSKEFTTWEDIAKIAIEISDSKSKINLKDKGISNKANIFNLDKIDKHFGLSFSCKEKIIEHIKYLIKN